MCRVAAKKLLNKALQIRREHAGSLLQAARLVQSMELTDKNDFGEGCHMASTEPFFYDSAYKLVKREYALPIDTNGRGVIAKKVVCTFGDIPRYSAKEPPMKWECSSECKIITDAEVCTIINPRRACARVTVLVLSVCVCVCVFPILAPRAIRRTNSSISDFSAIRA